MNSTIRGTVQNEYPNRPHNQKNTAISNSAKNSDSRFLSKLTSMTRQNYSPITASKSHWICIGGVKSACAIVWRAGRECGSGNISTQ